MSLSGYLRVIRTLLEGLVSFGARRFPRPGSLVIATPMKSTSTFARFSAQGLRVRELNKLRPVQGEDPENRRNPLPRI